MRYNDFHIFPNVFSYVKGDVTGDGKADNIYLIGTKTSDSPFIQNITLVIQDGSTGASTSIRLAENAGYNPTLSLYDFTGNGVLDILIGIESGGSGGIMYYYIYSFRDKIPRILFDFQKYNDQYQYKITYLDDYKVKVYSQYNQITYLIDISQKGSEYLNEIYDENKKLIQPIEGFVDPLSGLYPIDFDANGVYELMAFQKIAGRYHADSLGYIQNILIWKEKEFVLENQFAAIYGY
jgi:hypothetical protein